MIDEEGVIKFRLDHRSLPLQQAPGFEILNAWRGILWRLGLLGQDAARYGGLGYGNISSRLDTGGFLVTGTQTGHLAALSLEHYAWVTDTRAAENYLKAEGLTRPSSEALTHAAVYDASSQARCVVHSHSPAIWRQTLPLGLCQVAAEIAYGTPEMAEAVGDRVRRQPEQGVIAMLGHEDGLLAYGPSPEQACWLMIRLLAQVYAHPLAQPVGSVSS